MAEKIKVKIPILTQIQNELKAPKNQYNSFGKYAYRNAEDIESAVKPLLEKHGATLYITEDVKQVGDRIYLVETAHYKDAEQEIEVTGWAREPVTRKGMDDSQITGASSSYATKYALGKLFLIDDTKDADGMDNRQPKQTVRRQTRQVPRQQAPKIDQKKIDAAKNFTVTYGESPVKLVEVMKLESEGDKYASDFLTDWRKQDPKNEHAYQFIKKLGG